MDNLKPGTENDPNAPYNEINKECPICFEQMEETDSGKYKNRSIWREWECQNCKHRETEEPDTD